MKSKLSTAKKSKTTTFSRVFHPKKSTIFLGNPSSIFVQKMKISNSVIFFSKKYQISPEPHDLWSRNFACVIYSWYGRFLREKIREIEQKIEDDFFRDFFQYKAWKIACEAIKPPKASHKPPAAWVRVFLKITTNGFYHSLYAFAFYFEEVRIFSLVLAELNFPISCKANQI